MSQSLLSSQAIAGIHHYARIVSKKGTNPGMLILSEASTQELSDKLLSLRRDLVPNMGGKLG